MLHRIIDIYQAKGEPFLYVSYILHPESPLVRIDYIEMKPKGKNGTLSGTITNTRDLGIPHTKPVNGHGISTVLCTILRLL